MNSFEEFIEEQNEKMNKINSLTQSEKEEIYRIVRREYVNQDVKNRAELLNVELDDIQVDVIAWRYVYEGKYDNDLSYWQNIENLIEKEINA